MIFLSAVIICAVIVVWYSCESDPEESCKQDEICTDKFVTACCTESECVYKYNGKEYTEDQIDQLAKDLGCSTAMVLKGTEAQDNDLSEVIARLRALMDRVHESVASGK